MATAGGPKIVKDGLVFGYDTNYGVADNTTATRFYAGEPAVNLWDSLLSTQSLRSHTKHYWNGKKWTEDATYTHPGVGGPKDVYLGLVFKHVSGALNSTWSGTSYGYMLRDIACTNGATMTMSSWIYASTNCDVDAIPAVIEGESGGESTVTGYPSSYDLNNKGTWQVTAKKATSDGNTRFIPLYPRKGGVTDGSFTGFFMWALPQVTYGDRVVTPIQPGATRSSTASLIDLKETTDIDVSNVSFDSTGQPTFDGSDDRITIPAGSYETIGTNNFTIEAVCKNTKTSSYNHFFSVKDQYHFAFKASNTGTAILYVYRDSSLSTASTLPAYIPSRSEYYHIVCKREGDNLEIFVNGVSKGTKSGWNNISIDNDSWPSYIGSGHTNEYTGGDLPITKIYNRALSAEEVKNNFNGIKSRFGI